MPKVVVYSTGSCPYCIMAKRLLDRKGVPYEDVRIDKDPSRRAEMIKKSGRTSVPQIFINERHVGGFDDLSVLDMEGELDNLLMD